MYFKLKLLIQHLYNKVYLSVLRRSHESVFSLVAFYFINIISSNAIKNIYCIL